MGEIAYPREVGLVAFYAKGGGRVAIEVFVSDERWGAL